MMMGALQTEYLPGLLGLGHPAIWIIAVVFALALGAAIGAFQGLLIAYGGIPSFIVTLGGYLVWRGAAFQVAQGKTLAPMDVTFQLVGGGAHGSIGATFTWVLAIAACVAIVLLIIYSRRRRQMFGFPLRPIWAEVLLAVLGIGAVLLGALIAVSYMWPAGIVKEWAAQNNIVIPPEGIDIPMGIAVPVLIAICVALVMTIIATRRRFGRFVFAFGGNPEAAELAGINTRRTLLKVYVLMGFLVGISACISTARLNAATNNAGQLDELYVIAAAVDRRHIVLGRHRDHRRCRAGCAGDAVAPVGTHPDRCGCAHAEHRGRHRAGQCGRLRHLVSTEDCMSAIESSQDVRAATGSDMDMAAVPVVEMRNIRVAFGGVHAVEDVSVDLYPGEVMGLVGGNGAGKSTLMRALSGAHRADSGEILFDGVPQAIHNPRDAKALHVETIYQTLALADNLTASANLFLGRELVTRTGMTGRRRHGVGRPGRSWAGSIPTSRASRSR